MHFKNGLNGFDNLIEKLNCHIGFVQTCLSLEVGAFNYNVVDFQKNMKISLKTPEKLLQFLNGTWIFTDFH